MFARFTFTVAEPGGVSVAGMGVAHIKPAGKPPQLRATVWLKPPVAAKASV